MADVRDDINQAFKTLIDRRNPATIFPATVIAVNEADREIDIEDNDGNRIFGVMLAATEGDSSLLFLPLEGSPVLVANVGKSENLFFCVGFSELSKAVVKTVNTEIEVAPGGFKITRNGENLGQTLADLLDQIKLLTVTTPAGPSGTPINAAAFDLLKTRFDNLFA